MTLLHGPVSHVEEGGVFPLGLMVYLRYVTVKTGTWPLGAHQGRKTTVAHRSSLSPFTIQPPPDAGPAMLSQSFPREHQEDACQRNVCAHAQAPGCSHSRGWREDSPRGVFSLSVWPSGLHVSPSCHHWETGHHFLLSQSWIPPNTSRFWTHFTMSMVVATVIYCVPASV